MKEVALQAARKASAHMMKHFGKKLDVRKKQGKSLVTSVDVECEQIIINHLQKKYPLHNIVTEESSPIDNSSEYTWYIDPIDGTHNYVKGLPLFGVSIACAKNDEVILGVITLPYFKQTFIAQKGKSPRCNGKKIKVSTHKNVDFSTINFDGALEGRSKILATQTKMKKCLHSERHWGCAVYDAVVVACGNVDGWVIMNTNSWDIAAGFLLIEQAGGKVTDLKGNKWSINQRDFVASNGKLHQKLIHAIY